MPTRIMTAAALILLALYAAHILRTHRDQTPPEHLETIDQYMPGIFWGTWCLTFTTLVFITP